MTSLATHPLDDPDQLALIADDFWAKAHKTESCWLWTAGKTGGYGRFRVAGRPWYAHRLAYTLSVGPIPAGLTIDHLCMIRACVNPAHLEAVSRGENMRRGYAIPTRVAVRRSESCRNGHPRTDENVRIDPKSGKLHCRPCCAAAQRRCAARRAAA